MEKFDSWKVPILNKKNILRKFLTAAPRRPDGISFPGSAELIVADLTQCKTGRSPSFYCEGVSRQMHVACLLLGS